MKSYLVLFFFSAIAKSAGTTLAFRLARAQNCHFQKGQTYLEKQELPVSFPK
ncbi:hypothetical protein LEP1GSC195_3128 [Leptospira wolbachii serovar Codice str. CDC]|uniref:Uncharacterized protein n=1 Tax=Leptospira wolbachii serovar Codice str. CDC TaxID=1218599 RepID=R8ZZF8_9LEPT|nr:hypothetical protein LEP1GSC195_3128 [Leptospira wolbachii serovar Codice str. CDC]